MARKSKKDIIKELTELGIDFDARESYDNLAEQLRIELRDRKPQQPQETPPTDESDDENLQPLSEIEKARLNELEQMARMGRKIDQPTPAEMLELGKLRQRSKITE